MITVTRIDERLIHGQVAYAWTVAYRSDAIMVIDDECAKDDLQKMSLELACPSSLKCFVVGKEKAVELLNKYSKRKIFVVVKHPKYLLYLVENGIDLKSINVGGLYYKEDRKQISKTVFLDNELIEEFNKLHNLEVELEIRATPSDKPGNLISMLQK